MKKDNRFQKNRKVIFRAIRLFFFWSFISFVIISLMVRLSFLLIHTDDFKIKEILIRHDNIVTMAGEEFDYLRGKNLFTLNLKKEASKIAQRYPSCQKVRLIKFYPDHLFIDLIKRKAVASIGDYPRVCVDENAYIFEMNQSNTCESLPIIYGIEQWQVPLDRQSKSMQLFHALRIIKMLSKQNKLNRFHLKSLNVTQLSSASFILEPIQMASTSEQTSFEVRIGEEFLEERISFLATLLAQMGDNLYNIEYIDLRFQEPVIKFRQRKNKDY
ncbi:MAG: cell division protein FtsQ/DivIB [Candidatus Omnitrophica bacterium]|nr:cell division protein FtsQ/DivIB [Candidatus Omnitrophota bacterium]